MTDIILFGFGALADRLLRVLENDYPSIEVTGVIDNDAAKSGRNVGDLCPHGRFADLTVAPDLAACLNDLRSRPAVLVHVTESKPDRIERQLTDALEASINVVSASEAMFYPALRYGDFAARLDAAARANGVTVTGCGINPGFSYDTLPLVLARATSAVTTIDIRRTIDVTGTGAGDIEHVGYGLTPEAFRSRLQTGDIVGHMGAPESVALLAEFLGLPLDRITENWDIETASFEIDSGDPTLGILPPGRVIGITQEATGTHDGRSMITTKLSMYYQPERFGLDQADSISIEGAMPVRMTISPAIQSLFGAAHVIAATIADVTAARPGLVNVLDLPAGGSRRSKARLAIDPSRPLTPGDIPVRTVDA